ncbi:MAG TPA: hypothetical protein VHK22_00450 [Gaiellaceae bacterium]|jgi:hypothetical protein|nr:hypothetical protein [Gaiellaceae bacterium]
MRIIDALRERRRRRRERADRALVEARRQHHAESSSLRADAERVRNESRRNTMLPPDL